MPWGAGVTPVEGTGEPVPEGGAGYGKGRGNGVDGGGGVKVWAGKIRKRGMM